MRWIERIVLALLAAAVVAILLGSIAHFGLGIPRGTIRFDAIIGAIAIFFVVALATSAY